MQTYRIGRDPGNDIVVPDETVSREHAELRLTEDGELLLVDLNSTNGTCVEDAGEWIEIEQAEVDRGERVRIGEVLTSVSALIENARPRRQPVPLTGDMARRVDREPKFGRSPARPPVADEAASITLPGNNRLVPDRGQRLGGSEHPERTLPGLESARKAVAALRPSLPVSAIIHGDGEGTQRTKRGLAFGALLLALVASAAFGYLAIDRMLAGGNGADSDRAVASTGTGETSRAAPERRTEDQAAALPEPGRRVAAGGANWEQVLVAPGNQVLRSAVPSGGGVFAVGSVEVPAPGPNARASQRLWVTRFDASGLLSWQRFPDENADASATGVYPADGGGVIVAGDIAPDAARRVPWILHLNELGDIVWQKQLGDVATGIATHVTGIPGGYVVAAAVTLRDNGPVAALLTKLDGSGHILWTRTFDSGLVWPTAMSRTPDGGLVVVGTSKDRAEDTYALWAARLSNDGTVRWSRRYAEGTGEDGAAIVRRAARDQYIIATTHTTHGTEQRAVNVRLVRLDADGRRIWHHIHETPAPDRAAGLVLVPGGIIVAGSTRNGGRGERDLWIARFNTDGKVAWQRRYGGSGDAWATDLRQTRGRGLLVSAVTERADERGRDAWILWLDPEGLLQTH